jgi:uncharacterized OsmC-like protein
MSVIITGAYLGNKKVKLTHEPSGASYVTDAPKDNQGEGSSFSPTDTVAGALGACMLTIIGIIADRDGIDISNSHFRVEKHMTTTLPRRIQYLPVAIHLPKHLSEEIREKYERASKTCPVHFSIHPEIQVEINFIYDV